MKFSLRHSSFLAFCLLAATLPLTLRADPSTPPPSPIAVPVALAVPDTQTLALTLAAKGVQIYVCQPTPGPKPGYAWTFKAPEADLFDAQGNKAGHHYTGPTWELTDGSKVVGQPKGKIDSPDGKGVPWLLLTAGQTSGNGALTKVLSIRRIDTAGGKSPTEPADKTNAGQERRVPYTATYQFFVAKP